MPVGLQEIIALAIVIAVVSFGLYRRLRRSRKRSPGCCDQPGTDKQENTIHFYRRGDK